METGNSKGGSARACCSSISEANWRAPVRAGDAAAAAYGLIAGRVAIRPRARVLGCAGGTGRLPACCPSDVRTGARGIVIDAKRRAVRATRRGFEHPRRRLRGGPTSRAVLHPATIRAVAVPAPSSASKL